MKNLVKLKPEYWYGLSVAADTFGYFSRQDLIEKILVTWLDSQPDLLEKGRERASLEERIKDNIKRKVYDDPTKLLVSVPDLRGTPKNPLKRYRYKFRDGRMEELNVQYPQHGVVKLMGKTLTQEEYDEIFDGPPEFLGDVKPPRII